ncbi:MAG: hypothetical protein JWO84_738, partial [Parcubacteria group bacterium]|nr:hypothetical protein [Parcubacteria group bacterium]
DIGAGIAAKSPFYVGGRVTGTIKQLGQDNWNGKLDDNYIDGQTLFAFGMKVFSAGDRVYAKHMTLHCRYMSAWVAHYGKRVFAPVTQ